MRFEEVIYCLKKSVWQTLMILNLCPSCHGSPTEGRASGPGSRICEDCLPGRGGSRLSFFWSSKWLVKLLLCMCPGFVVLLFPLKFLKTQIWFLVRWQNWLLWLVTNTINCVSGRCLHHSFNTFACCQGHAPEETSATCVECSAGSYSQDIEQKTEGFDPTVHGECKFCISELPDPQ